MLRNNRELCLSLWLIAGSGAVFAAVGFALDIRCGILVLTACAAMLGIHLGTEAYRYRRLKKLSRDLDALLTGGSPMAIRDYTEGELSILANQIQKLTLCLTEAADTVRAEKRHLADSLADISHQLRTPLTAMNLTVALLRSPNLPEERRIALTGQLRSLLDRTDWLVETLLKLSRLDAGIVTMAAEPVAVRALIDRAAAPLAIPMELREQQLVVDCGKETFTGDLVWSAEALGNLLKNAMEHTPLGGRITVAARETALYTCLTVTDTGPGFAPGEIPRLFERFYKGANAAENSYGIGLALARTIITAQNGTIQASNTPEGAKFTVKFHKQVL